MPRAKKTSKKAEGIELRDLLALACMHGIVSSTTHDFEVDNVAKDSYAVADAMLEAREGSLRDDDDDEEEEGDDDADAD